MNKLEVGMYVRTFYGKIYKITELDLQFEMTKQNCKKASHNIIDLIEVGDYVNGSKVSIIESEFIYWETGNAIHCKYIESIVTKEQFKSMEYKVNE